MALVIVVMSWIAMCFSLVGAAAMTFGKPDYVPITLGCFSIASFLWFIYATFHGLIPLIILNSIFCCLEVYSFTKWFKKSQYRKDKIVDAVDKVQDELTPL